MQLVLTPLQEVGILLVQQGILFRGSDTDRHRRQCGYNSHWTKVQLMVIAVCGKKVFSYFAGRVLEQPLKCERRSV
jgi:hypothetical protein